MTKKVLPSLRVLVPATTLWAVCALCLSELSTRAVAVRVTVRLVGFARDVEFADVVDRICVDSRAVDFIPVFSWRCLCFAFCFREYLSTVFSDLSRSCV